jgi:hypothetical protein
VNQFSNSLMTSSSYWKNFKVNWHDALIIVLQLLLLSIIVSDPIEFQEDRNRYSHEYTAQFIMNNAFRYEGIPLY